MARKKAEEGAVWGSFSVKADPKQQPQIEQAIAEKLNGLAEEIGGIEVEVTFG